MNHRRPAKESQRLKNCVDRIRAIFEMKPELRAAYRYNGLALARSIILDQYATSPEKSVAQQAIDLLDEPRWKTVPAKRRMK